MNQDWDYAMGHTVELSNGFENPERDVNDITEEELNEACVVLTTAALQKPQMLFDLGFNGIDFKRKSYIVQEENETTEVEEIELNLNINLIKRTPMNEQDDPSYTQLALKLERLIEEED